MDNDTNKPLRACRKLINLVLTMLCRPGEPLRSNEVIIEDGSLKAVTSSIMPINKVNNGNGRLGTDISVDFRHITDGATRGPKKNGLMEQTMQQKHVSVAINQGKWLKDVETLHKAADQGSGRIMKNVSIKAGNGDKGKKEAKRPSDEGAKPVTEAQKQLGPLMSINEKSDSYIRRKKKEMIRNYSFDITDKS